MDNAPPACPIVKSGPFDLSAWTHAALALSAALGASLSLPVYAQQGAPQLAPSVMIVGITPLPGIGQPLNEIAAPVQVAKSRDIARSGALELSDFMNRHLGSVHVNEVQGNPFQMDVSYRGYTASPLLGTPQGLSVYLDGMRMNQAFGDVVSWDLIPRNAIASITLMPGSNPLFGMNTLGGALSIQTKDGKSDPGTVLQTTLGSNARRALEMEHGGANELGLNWYLSGNLFKERGWRDDSPSEVRQLLSKLGWHGGATDLKLTLSHADNHLAGNGLQEQSLLARDRTSVYTKPDITQNRSSLLNLALSHTISESLQLSGNAYYRDIQTASVNGDMNEAALDQAVYQPSAADQAALAAAGYRGYPSSGANASNTPFPYWRCIAQAWQNAEPAEQCNGLINRTQSAQKNYGLSGQLSWFGAWAGKRNQLVLGAGYDASRISFAQSSQLGYLNPDRSITGVNAFGDGVTGGTVVGDPYDTRVSLTGRSHSWSVFASDTLSFGERLHLSLSGRYNKSIISNRDQLHAAADVASLSSEQRFARFNPAIGVTYTPIQNAHQTLNLYAGYNQSSRTPTAIELGCANPEQPCKLPNAMAGDPPLNQVITRTIEAGMRGTVAGNLQWNAGIFRAVNQDDILFVADNQAGFGYFKNFGQTRRQGLELGLSGKIGQLSLGAHYTWLEATYQSSEIVNGSGNSSNDAALAGAAGMEGRITIQRGDRIPFIPRHMLKLFADYAVTPAFTLHGGIVAMSGALARGNENNGHQPDGGIYLGQGHSAGYAIANLGASYHVTTQWQVIAQINNLFDTRYNSAAQLGANGFDASGNFVARPFGGSSTGGYPNQQSTFYAPGAPRLFWIGLRYALEKPAKG